MPPYQRGIINLCLCCIRIELCVSVHADVDECEEPTMNNCNDSRSMCINTEGSYACQCSPGYRGNGFTCGEMHV